MVSFSGKSPSPCGSRSSHVEAFPTDRLLQILIALGQAPEALSAKELSLTLGQPLSSTYRHLKTLLRWGLAEEQAGQGRYLPGPACLQLAKKFDREASLIGLAKPELKRLADLSQESVALMVASNQQAICLELFDSPQPLRCCYQKGLAQPLLHGASAKALLAHLEDERREELYLAQELSAERIDKLEQELRLIREQLRRQPGRDRRRRLGHQRTAAGQPPAPARRPQPDGPALRAQSRSECLRQWTLDAAARLSARLD